MFRRVRSLLLALGAPFAVAAQEAPVLDGIEWAQVSIHERIIIRVPQAVRASRADAASRYVPAPPAVVWNERKAPRCVALSRLAGAAVTRGGDVDLMLSDGKRLRAKLDDDCPALSFYAGFYLKPTADGMLCGGRDAFRARSGAACPIAKFRKLVAQR